MQRRLTNTFTIGELARRTGVAASALRFYEERGLIAPKRNRSGHRRYPREIARRVAFIVFAQRVGLSLSEIGEELAKLPSDRIPRESDWERLTTLWHARIEDRIDELRRLQHSLTRCIGCGCLSLQTCAVMNRGDWTGDAGPGPYFWQEDSGSPAGNDA